MKLPRRAVAALVLAAGSFAPAAAPEPKDAAQTGGWSQWRGPNRDGKSAETGLMQDWPAAGPKLVWKADLGGVGYGTPVAAGNRLFVMAAEDPDKGANEYALGLDAGTGKQLWKTPFANKPGGYSTNWGSGPRGTPTADGEFVYCLGAMGDLLCLKQADGSKVWAVNLVSDFAGRVPSWGYSESVLIDSDKLLCTPGGKDGSVLALDKKTGKKLWQSAGLTDGAGYASIIAADVGGVRQYITQTMQSACGVRASDGKPLWRVAELKRATAVIPTPVVFGDHAFFTAGYGAGCELIKLEPDGAGGTKATAVYTKNANLQNHHGGVILIGDRIYGHSDKGGWTCLDPMKGEPVWNASKLEKGSVTFADGRLYCYGQAKGTCVLAEATPEGWKEHGRFELPVKSQFPRRSGQIWTHPVVAGGKLYLRDHEVLMAFDVRGK